MADNTIENDRKIVRDFASWIGMSGKKYITGLPFGYSMSSICESMRNLVRHDVIASKSLDKIRRSFS